MESNLTTYPVSVKMPFACRLSTTDEDRLNYQNLTNLITRHYFSEARGGELVFCQQQLQLPQPDHMDQCLIIENRQHIAILASPKQVTGIGGAAFDGLKLAHGQVKIPDNFLDIIFLQLRISDHYSPKQISLRLSSMKEVPTWTLLVSEHPAR
jgi:hypothetical protein